MKGWRRCWGSEWEEGRASAKLNWAWIWWAGGEWGWGGLQRFVLKWQLSAEERTDLKCDGDFMIGWADSGDTWLENQVNHDILARDTLELLSARERENFVKRESHGRLAASWQRIYGGDVAASQKLSDSELMNGALTGTHQHCNDMHRMWFDDGKITFLVHPRTHDSSRANLFVCFNIHSVIYRIKMSVAILC